jgi:phage anti-repressor protein
MDAFIQITSNEQGSEMVSARELHEKLEINTEFRHWIKRMFEYGFTQNIDYTPFNFEHPLNRQLTVDYWLTIDTAKEIAMLQRTDKGKEIRQYFIQYEKRSKELLHHLTRPQTDVEILSNAVVVANRLIAQQQTALLEAGQKVENLQIGLDNLLSWISILKVASHNRVSEKVFDWRKLKAKSLEMGYEVKRTESNRFTYQNLYHVDVFRVCYPQFNYDLKTRDY